MFREFFNSTVAMLKVFVWEPIRKFFAYWWNACFGPCCDNPNLTWSEGPGFTISSCRNCRTTKTYTRAGF